MANLVPDGAGSFSGQRPGSSLAVAGLRQSSVPRRINAANVKYMMSPVTSTSVATNGAEALAGSSPQRRKMNGNIEPAMVPKVTTPTKLHAIVSASKR